MSNMRGVEAELTRIGDILDRLAIALEVIAFPEHIFVAKTLQCHCAPGEHCSNCSKES